MGQWQRASAVVLLLSRCASVQPVASPSPGIEIPPNWSVADATSIAGASSLVEWWARFEDPVLNRLVADAAQANTSIKSAQAALRQARALRDVAAASLSPVLGSSASAQRSKSGAPDKTSTDKASTEKGSAALPADKDALAALLD